jgi:hypothetical protein
MRLTATRASVTSGGGVAITALPDFTYGITSAGGVFNLRSAGTVNYDVEWGDGDAETSTLNTLPHTYVAGNYSLLVNSSGVYRPYFDNVTADVSQITSVTIGPRANLGTNLTSAWYGASNITSFACPFDVTSGVTSFNSAWRGCSNLATFPLIDTSSGTDFTAMFFNCTGLTSIPLIDTSNGTDFDNFCKRAAITTFPALDLSSSTRFLDAWYDCSSLADFPANMFDTTGTLFFNAFRQSWSICALTAQSIENILVSLDTNGASSITLGISGGTNAKKSTWSAAANTAYTNLINKGWTITFNA